MHNTYESIHVCWKQNMCRCKVFRIDAYCNANKPQSVWCVWVDLKHEWVDLKHEWVDTSHYVSMHILILLIPGSYVWHESMHIINESMHRSNVSMQVFMYRCKNWWYISPEPLNSYESMQDAMHRCIQCLYRSMLLCIDARHVFQLYQYAMYRCKERMSRLILKQNDFCEFSNCMSRCNAFCINSKPHYE